MDFDEYVAKKTIKCAVCVVLNALPSNDAAQIEAYMRNGGTSAAMIIGWLHENTKYTLTRNQVRHHIRKHVNGL